MSYIGLKNNNRRINMDAVKEFIALFKANWKSFLIYGAVCFGIGFIFGGGLIGKLVALILK